MVNHPIQNEMNGGGRNSIGGVKLRPVDTPQKPAFPRGIVEQAALPMDSPDHHNKSLNIATAKTRNQMDMGRPKMMQS